VKRQDDSLIDTFDKTSDYYEICAAMKVKGSSNAELKHFLDDEGFGIDERNALVKRVDEDYLQGLLGKKEQKNYVVFRVLAFIIGWIFICGGIIGLLYMFFSGRISIWVATLMASVASAGVTLVFTNGKKRRAKRQSVFEQNKKKRL